MFRIGKLVISKRTFWIIAVIYGSIVLTLKYKFNSPIGEFLIQIGYIALIIGIIFIIYRMIKVTTIYILNKYFR